MPDMIGVIVGGALALVGSFAAKWWDGREESNAVKGAFRAEIASILNIAEARQHEKKAAAFISEWKAGRDLPIKYFGSDQAHNDSVFQANVGKIGLLDRRLASDVTTFYSYLLAVRITIRAFEEGAFANEALAFRIAMAEEALEIWRKTEALGRSLIRTL